MAKDSGKCQGGNCDLAVQILVFMGPGRYFNVDDGDTDTTNDYKHWHHKSQSPFFVAPNDCEFFIGRMRHPSTQGPP